MKSRNEFIKRLYNLKHYKFIGYLEQIARDVHLVRFCIEDFRKANLPSNVYIIDFIVFDTKGGLSAKSKCGVFVIDSLN